MNIVPASARLMRINGRPGTEGYGVDALRAIEFVGRISHRSEDAITHDSHLRFIQAVVLGHGDWSIVEHCSATVDFTVDRGITHEIVRHRLFSYIQESTRFVNYEKKMPPSFICPFDGNPNSPLTGDSINNDRLAFWRAAVATSEASYRDLINIGVAPQIARSVLPNALASRILMTGNFRSWRHFLIMRTTKESHPQMREVTIPLLAQFKECIPLLFDDIEPNQHQAANMRLPR